MPMRWLDQWRQRNGPFAALFKPPPDAHIISIDLETTGLDTTHCRILSIAAVAIAPPKLLTSQALVMLVRDDGDIGIDSMRFHQLRRADLSAGLSLPEALTQLLHFVGSRPLLGYCVGFDVAVLNRECQTHFGFQLPNRRIELMDQYEHAFRRQRPHEEPKLDFDSMLRQLDLPDLARHDAYADAVAAAMAWLKLREGLPPKR
jgi:DNA polymerase III subunit epsilon